MSNRENSINIIIAKLEDTIKKQDLKIKQLQDINHDALLRNCEMAKELREYQKRNTYKELKTNGKPNDI